MSESKFGYRAVNIIPRCSFCWLCVISSIKRRHYLLVKWIEFYFLFENCILIYKAICVWVSKEDKEVLSRVYRVTDIFPLISRKSSSPLYFYIIVFYAFESLSMFGWLTNNFHIILHFKLLNILIVCCSV